MSEGCCDTPPECAPQEGDTGAGSASGCLPGPGNAPVQFRFDGPLQRAVDAGRRAAIQAGAHGYKVSLVWVRRDAQQVFREVKRIDLMPARVDRVSEVRWTTGETGAYHEGTLLLSWVSLSQVSDQDLLGHLDGADPPSDVEFLIEVTRFARCPDDRPEPQRYAPASLPEFDLLNHQWVMTIQDAHQSRTPSGQDQTLKPLAPNRRRSKLRL